MNYFIASQPFVPDLLIILNKKTPFIHSLQDFFLKTYSKFGALENKHTTCTIVFCFLVAISVTAWLI